MAEELQLVDLEASNRLQKISSLEELVDVATKYSEGHIFRGQTTHYVNDNGGISVNTSFDRNGCVPPTMQKWMLYCEEILRCLKGPEFDGAVDLVECQAVLQHYGWRSFFIDFSRRLDVSCWFASNVYSEEFVGRIGEDWQEKGLWSLHKKATYSEHVSCGYIYIVQEAKLTKHQIKTSDVERFRFSDFCSRFDRQSAVMVGPVSILPEAAIVATLQVPVGVLRQYSINLSMHQLFPGRDEDLIYKFLLDAPFVLKNSDTSELGDFGPYVRDLEIPEYDYSFVKRPPTHVAFYRYGYLIKPDAVKSVLVRTPDWFLHHVNIDSGDKIDGVLNLFQNTDTLIIEAEGMIRWPSYSGTSLYLKGAIIRYVNIDQICISGLMTSHPGMAHKQIIEDRGWHYNIVGGYLSRVSSSADCPCNNKRKHQLELTIVKKLQCAITDGLIRYQGGYHKVIKESS